MSSKVSAGLFLIGMGIGTTLNSLLALPEQLSVVKQALWVILIIVGVALIIKGHN